VAQQLISVNLRVDETNQRCYRHPLWEWMNGEGAVLMRRETGWRDAIVDALRRIGRRRRYRRLAARIDRVTLGEHLAYWRARLGNHR
jgi:hypothetical protein